MTSSHSNLTDEESNRFRFHPATAKTGPTHDAVRSEVLALACTLTTLVPAGRHRSLMLTSLQEAMMWANAAVACDTTPEPGSVTA